MESAVQGDMAQTVSLDVTLLPKYGLKRRQRLTHSKIFEEIFAKGRRVVGRFMVMLALDVGGGSSRLGVIATKQAIPRAVDRSRAKRLLREAYRLNRHRLANGYDVILLARRPLVAVDRRAAESELLYLARRIGIWRGEERENSTT